MTPIDLLMIGPFISAGNALFGINENVTEIFGLLTTDIKAALSSAGMSILRGILAWLLVSPLITLLVYLALLPFITSFMKAKGK